MNILEICFLLPVGPSFWDHALSRKPLTTWNESQPCLGMSKKHHFRPIVNFSNTGQIDLSSRSQTSDKRCLFFLPSLVYLMCGSALMFDARKLSCFKLYSRRNLSAGGFVLIFCPVKKPKIKLPSFLSNMTVFRRQFCSTSRPFRIRRSKQTRRRIGFHLGHRSSSVMASLTR